MKKLCLVLGLAGLLSMPSIVFGEATWYGSFRGGVESAGGSSHMFSNGSRWGVKGSNEISEGLTANYRYEEALDLATASLSTGNRLSYVGLSGGFGTISIGRVWSASFNSVGAILDNSYIYGDSFTSYRVGPAVSYSNSAGAANLQVDLVMDKGNKAKSGVDHYEFGLSFDLGAATLAFAHRKKNFAMVTSTTQKFVEGTAGTPTQVTVVNGMPGTPPTVTVEPGTANVPTMVTVVPAIAAVEPEDAIDEETGAAQANRQTLISTKTGKNVEASGDNAVATLAEATKDACDAIDGAIWVSGADTSNVDDGCYAKSLVTLRMNTLKSAKVGTGATAQTVTPVDNDIAHLSEANCTAADTDPDTTGVQAGVYEHNSKMCYPNGTTLTYITKAAVAAVEEVKAEPIKVEVEDGVAGVPPVVTVVPGVAGTPTQVTVTPGTPGTPSKFVTETTTTPAYDETMNAVAVKFAAGSHSAAVGLVKKSDSMGGESSTTVANAGGPLSDGLSYHFNIADTEGSASNPWLIGMSKSLGGGSTLILEHADAGDENKTAVYLQVDF